MSASPIISSYTEVSRKVLMQTPEHEQFFTSLFPWDQIHKVEEHEDLGQFRITLNGPIRGDLDHKGKKEDFTQDGREMTQKFASFIKGGGQQSEWIKKLLLSSIQQADLTEVWKGLNQSHLLWDKEIVVKLDDKMISFETSDCLGLRIGLNIHDSTQVLSNLLPYTVYLTTAVPLFVTKGIMKATWSGAQSLRPIQVTFNLKKISFHGAKIKPSLGVEKSRSISFKQKEGEVPFKVTTALSSEVPEELLEFFGKYVSWTAI